MRPTSPPKIFGAGLIALDMVFSSEARVGAGCWAGGTCGNVLSILAYLGWDAYPIARLNGDGASRRIRDDMARWGVHLDLTNCAPTTDTPIIVQKIRRRPDGRSRHQFSWSCPTCGKCLPSFKAITIEAGEVVKPMLVDASVFFLDRLSRATLTLAAEASIRGAVVVFEPSSNGNSKLMSEAVQLAHIVKYADDRLSCIPGTMEPGSATMLEVKTLAERGLTYRYRLDRGVSNWLNLKSRPAPRLTDTCGAGDWCTAGLIASVAAGGVERFRWAGARRIREALRYGQALAAWNCCFEGARGGMYAVPKEEFRSQIESLMHGRPDRISESPLRGDQTPFVGCPACPSEGDLVDQ